MKQRQFERLERLQKLRADNALTDAEFETEKAKVLAAVPAVTNKQVVTIALIAAAVVVAVLLGLWLSQDIADEGPKPARPMKVVASAPTPAATVETRSEAARLTDAFVAATGHQTAFTKTIGGERLTTTPIRIIQLPFGPALLTKTEIKDGCHACVGAIGVYYLVEAGGQTKVTGKWPKAVEGWGWGAAPAEWRVTNMFTSNPAIYAEGGYMGQGVVTGSATITELRPSGPITSDVIGTSYSDEGARSDDDERPVCTVKGRVANVRKDQSFDVIVSGSLSTVNHYSKRNGKFASISKTDWGLPCGY